MIYTYQEPYKIFLTQLRDCLHWGGGPSVGEVTRFVGVTHLSIWYLVLIFLRLHDTWGSYMTDYMDRWVTPPKRVTSPTWGPVPHLHAKRPEEGIFFRP